MASGGNGLALPPQLHKRWPSVPELRAGDVVALGGLVLPLVYLAWQRGGVEPAEQMIAFGWVLALTALCCLFPRRIGVEVTLPWPAGVIVLLPLLQLIPLPLQTLGTLSPLRLELIERFSQLGVESPSSLSIHPSATLHAAIAVAGCCALFLLARAAARGSERAVLVTTVPVLLFGLVEAGIGLHQYLRGQLLADLSPTMARGTFVNRNHFATLLGACFGVSLGLLFVAVEKLRRRHWTRENNTLGIVAATAATTAYLLGVILSFSRGGIVVVGLIGLVALATMTCGSRLASRGKARVRSRGVAPSRWGLLRSSMIPGCRDTQAGPRRGSKPAVVSGLLLTVSLLATVGIASSIGTRGLGERFEQLISQRGDPSRLAIWSDTLRSAQGH